MTEGVPEKSFDPTTPSGWERDSLLAKVHERIVWIRNRNHAAFTAAIARITESDSFLRDGQSLPDFFLVDSVEARAVATELHIDYELLISPVYISKERLLEESA